MTTRYEYPTDTLSDMYDREHDAVMANVQWRVTRDADGYGIAVRCTRPAACAWDDDLSDASR